MTKRTRRNALRHKPSPPASMASETVRIKRNHPIGGKLARVVAVLPPDNSQGSTLRLATKSGLTAYVSASDVTLQPKLTTIARDDYERAVRGDINPTQRDMPGHGPVRGLPNPPRVDVRLGTDDDATYRAKRTRLQALGIASIKLLEEASEWVQLCTGETDAESGVLLKHWSGRLAEHETQLAEAERKLAQLGRARAQRSRVLPARSPTTPTTRIEDMPGTAVRPNVDVVEELAAIERTARAAIAATVTTVVPWVAPALPDIWRLWMNVPSVPGPSFERRPRKRYARMAPKQCPCAACRRLAEQA